MRALNSTKCHDLVLIWILFHDIKCDVFDQVTQPAPHFQIYLSVQFREMTFEMQEYNS